MQSVSRRTNLIRLLTLALLLTLCSIPAFGADPEPASEPEANTGVPADPAAEPHPAFNDGALFIAGLSNRQGPLSAYENQPAWASYARFIGQSWERFDRSHLAPMRAWSAQELSTANPATVFYPFSGPDIVNMYTLFPHARTYLMIALEPVGRDSRFFRRS